MVADSEVLKVLVEILTSLKLGEFEVKLNHRKLLDAMLDIAGGWGDGSCWVPLGSTWLVLVPLVKNGPRSWCAWRWRGRGSLSCPAHALALEQHDMHCTLAGLM